jgi:hypothetical protein
MPVWSLLLRLVLCLSLALNPVATAFAGTHAHQQARATGPSDPVHTEVARVACHDLAAVTEESPAHEPFTHAKRDQGSPVERATVDCCQSDACQCACVHLSQALLPGPAAGLDGVMGAAIIRQAGALHATPALPHLIRPPIRPVC